MSSKYVKKNSISLGIEKGKSKLNYVEIFLTLLSMAVIKKTTTNADKGGGTMIHCWWECKLA
jgi:hypothetical protein